MFKSTKVIELGSCAFRQPTATSHCKYLHGYRLTAKFWFEADSLDQNNWVVDFGGLKDLKTILQDQFDHTTCVSAKDPKLSLFKQLFDEGLCDLRIMDGVGIEKFAEWCWEAADKHVVKITDGRCKCVKVEVFEHENNSAIYEKQYKAVDTAVENDKSLNDFMGNKTDPVKQKREGVPLSSNASKTVNSWVNKNNPNTFGI